MPDPVVVPRAGHAISRRDIDPDALKVLYRLQQFEHTAYLVGGSVRDLLVGRKPKDFDIGTSAHPYQIKRLFRNCWIIGRRFRLAHVKFGTKTIEVATFRRQVPAGTENEPAMPRPEGNGDRPEAGGGHPRRHPPHDNSFGSAEEDAFRRDFTVNALFYDIATRSIIDYVGGLQDIRAGLIRSIGDPDERFTEDPVRMLRAVALEARLGFSIDPPVREAIARHRLEIGRAAPPRLLEELYKILRGGHSAKVFRGLVGSGLLDPIAPELARAASTDLWRSLEALDRYRQRFDGIPAALTNAILIGSLLVPAGLVRIRGGSERAEGVRTTLGLLPLARHDLERLVQLLGLQRRLLDPTLSARGRRALAHRSVFGEALLWLEIHGGADEASGQWRAFLNEEAAAPAAERPHGGRRSRRRRRRRGRTPRPSTEE